MKHIKISFKNTAQHCLAITSVLAMFIASPALAKHQCSSCNSVSTTMQNGTCGTGQSCQDSKGGMSHCKCKSVSGNTCHWAEQVNGSFCP